MKRKYLYTLVIVLSYSCDMEKDSNDNNMNIAESYISLFFICENNYSTLEKLSLNKDTLNVDSIKSSISEMRASLHMDSKSLLEDSVAISLLNALTNSGNNKKLISLYENLALSRLDSMQRIIDEDYSEFKNSYYDLWLEYYCKYEFLKHQRKFWFLNFKYHPSIYLAAKSNISEIESRLKKASKLRYTEAMSFSEQILNGHVLEDNELVALKKDLDDDHLGLVDLELKRIISANTPKEKIILLFEK